MWTFEVFRFLTPKPSFFDELFQPWPEVSHAIHQHSAAQSRMLCDILRVNQALFSLRSSTTFDGQLNSECLNFGSRNSAGGRSSDSDVHGVIAHCTARKRMNITSNGTIDDIMAALLHQ